MSTPARRTLPSHIVLLRKPEHDLHQVLHDTGLRRKPQHRPECKHGTMEWPHGDKEGGRQETYHPTLGVACLHLDTKEAARLRDHKDVQGVYENRRRCTQARRASKKAAQPRPVEGNEDDEGRRHLPPGGGDGGSDDDEGRRYLPPGGGNDSSIGGDEGRRYLPLGLSGDDEDDDEGRRYLPLEDDEDDDENDRRWLPDDEGRRYLPLDTGDEGRRWLPGHSAAQFTSGKGGPCGCLDAYAQGQRDAWEQLLSVLQRKGRGRKKRYANTAELTWGLSAIGLTPHYPLTGKDVKVAVLDTGIDTEHPDFAGRLHPQHLMNFLEPGTLPADRLGHGTHCCGILAGHEPAGVRRYSVAPGCTLLVGKVLDNDGGGHDSDILRGIAWAAESGADVICLSLGSPEEGGGTGDHFYQAVAERLVLAPKECLLIAAAGNGSHRSSGLVAPIYHPAATPSIVAAAAMNRAGRIADFSCGQLHGHEGLINFAAPGVGILSARTGGGHVRRSGTSMAVPFVAGVAALILSQDPDLSPREVWEALERLALPLGRSMDAGRGCVQVPGVPRHY